MTHDTIIMLIRVAILVLPACALTFLIGYLLGRRVSTHLVEEWLPMQDHYPPPPDVEPMRVTRLTSRNQQREF